MPGLTDQSLGLVLVRSQAICYCTARVAVPSPARSSLRLHSITTHRRRPCPPRCALTPGAEFEKRILANEKNNVKFNFLVPTDPYHAYYRLRVSSGGARRSSSADLLQGRAAACCALAWGFEP